MVKENKLIKYNSESEVLKKLRIKTFEKFDDSKIIKLALLLPKIEPELAKTIINKLPEFCHVIDIMASIYKEIAIKAVENDDLYTRLCLDRCESLLDDLNKEKNSENISVKDRNRIMDEIIQIMKIEKDIIEQNRKNKISIIQHVEKIVSSIILLVVPLAGAGIYVRQHNGIDLNEKDLSYECENEESV